nr:MAG TPA: hypothetical protein [Caudoviricetes sp.]
MSCTGPQGGLWGVWSGVCARWARLSARWILRMLSGFLGRWMILASRRLVCVGRCVRLVLR